LEGSQLPILESELSLKTALTYLTSGFLGLLDWWMNEEPAASPEEMADLLFLIFSMRPCDIIKLNLVPEEGTGIHLNLSGGENDWLV